MTSSVRSVERIVNGGLILQSDCDSAHHPSVLSPDVSHERLDLRARLLRRHVLFSVGEDWRVIRGKRALTPANYRSRPSSV